MKTQHDQAGSESQVCETCGKKHGLSIDRFWRRLIPAALRRYQSELQFTEQDLFIQCPTGVHLNLEFVDPVIHALAAYGTDLLRKERGANRNNDEDPGEHVNAVKGAK